jgi:hypothetical protein
MSKTRFVLLGAMLFLWLGAVNAATINGNLRDANTRANVDSAVVTFTNSSGSVFTGQTDARGDYSIANIPAQPASGALAITRTGYRPFQVSVSNVMNNTTIDIALIPISGGAARLTGTITDQPTGNAIQGAQIILLLDGYRTVLSPCDTTITAANGSYTFDSLIASNNSQFDIIVSKTGFFPAGSAGITLTNGQTRAVNIGLAPVGNKIGMVKGKVTSAVDQAAIANAKVALNQNATGVLSTLINSTMTNQSGDYAFDSIPVANGYQLSISATGFASQNSTAFRVDSGVVVTRNMALGVIVLPNSIIKGAVTDSASSNAIAGARVVLRTRSGVWQALDTAVTAANGTYSFTGLDVGEYSLIVDMTDYRTYATPPNVPITIAVNPDTLTINVALAGVAKGNMCVFVGDDGGNAVGGALVSTIEKPANNQAGQTYSGTTATTGWVTLANIICGTYDITVAKTGYNTTTQGNRTVRPGGIDTTTIALVKATGAAKVVKGAAKTTAGAGLTDVAVTLTAQRPGAAILTLVCTSKADGSYEIIGIPAGITTADLLFCRSGFTAKDTNGIALVADTTTVNVLWKAISTEARDNSAAITTHATKKTSIRVYGLDGRLIALFAHTDCATVLNSLSKTIRTHQSVILKWIENGRTMQRRTVIR